MPTRRRAALSYASACVLLAGAPLSGSAQWHPGPAFGPGPQTIRQMPTDELIDHTSLARERDESGRPKFTWADEEFVRRLDANHVTWGQLAKAVEHMQVMRVQPGSSAHADIIVWMRLPEWWRSVELIATPRVPNTRELKCNTFRWSCGAGERGQEESESKHLLGRFSPGHHDVQFDAVIRSTYWQADARDTWRPTFTLRFDVVDDKSPHPAK